MKFDCVLTYSFDKQKSNKLDFFAGETFYEYLDIAFEKSGDMSPTVAQNYKINNIVTENVIASLKRGLKGKQRMHRRNKFSFAIAIALVQLNQFDH